MEGVGTRGGRGGRWGALCLSSSGGMSRTPSRTGTRPPIPVPQTGCPHPLVPLSLHTRCRRSFLFEWHCDLSAVAAIITCYYLSPGQGAGRVRALRLVATSLRELYWVLDRLKCIRRGSLSSEVANYEGGIRSI